ncbi:MAG: NAD-dependent dehydratase [Acidobacteria bacterium]|nr:MAG: NAD-dependent dehydratase [Acidobacteriota bacterium]
MSWSGRKALVTGATGFIGSHLTESLVRAGAKVRALVHYNADDRQGNLELLSSDIRKEIEVVRGDIRNPEGMDAAAEGVDVVFHLAALIAIPYSYVNPREHFETNVIGTYNVARAAQRAGVERFVHTSTSEVYGTARFTPITEDHPLQGQSPYSASKIGADKAVESLQLSFDLPAVTVRPFNTYGPRQSRRAIIPAIISQLLTSSTLRLGSLEPERDLTFASDTADGFIAAADALASDAVGQTFNLGNGASISIGELANRLIEMIRPGARIETDPARVRPAKSEVGLLLASNEKARTVLKWEPRVGLDEGLERTAEFMTKQSELGTDYAI